MFVGGIDWGGVGHPRALTNPVCSYWPRSISTRVRNERGKTERSVAAALKPSTADIGAITPPRSVFPSIAGASPRLTLLRSAARYGFYGDPGSRHYSKDKPLTWLGWAVVVLGLLAIVSPLTAGKATVILVGKIWLIAGLAQLLAAFRADQSASSRLLAAILGAITAVAAIFVLAHHLLGLRFSDFPTCGLPRLRGFLENHCLAPEHAYRWLTVALGERHLVPARGFADMAAVAVGGHVSGWHSGWSKFSRYRHSAPRFRRIHEEHPAIGYLCATQTKLRDSEWLRLEGVTTCNLSRSQAGHEPARTLFR